MVSEVARIRAPTEELVDGSRQARRESGPNGRSRGRNSESMRTQQRGVCWKGVQGPAGTGGPRVQSGEAKISLQTSDIRVKTSDITDGLRRELKIIC